MKAARLVTPRLILRRARMSDLHDLHRAFGHPAAMRYWSRPEHESPAVTRRMLQTMCARAHPGQMASDDFVIEYQGLAIGKAGAWTLPEIGFLLHPDFWRRGLAEEAMRSILPYLFAMHPVDALTAEVDPRNAACLRLLAKLGFAETGRARNTMLWGDAWVDSVYLVLPRPAVPPGPA
jgi:RimJ/RimL family protein N-acetyltransferase